MSNVYGLHGLFSRFAVVGECYLLLMYEALWWNIQIWYFEVSQIRDNRFSWGRIILHVAGLNYVSNFCSCDETKAHLM